MYHQRNLAVAISAALAISVLSGCSGQTNLKQADSYQTKINDTEFQKAAYHLTQKSSPKKAVYTASTQNDLRKAAEILGISKSNTVSSPRIRKVSYKPLVKKRQRNKWQKAKRYTSPKVQQRATYKAPRGDTDMWKRIYRGRKLGAHLNRSLVKRFIREYSSNRPRLERISNRASNYLSMVVAELERRKMPTELALLPFVESAYVNTARSPAAAAGMWQFIPSTGKMYGLKQTRGYDARMDSFESTRAALDYLQKLNREFHGDWFLSLAAYNAGEGRVGRAIRENRRKGRPTDYWNLRLPKETREYVPRLLAYKEIIHHPWRYHLRLPKATSRATLVEARVNKALDLRKVARHAGLPSKTLTALNPSYLHGITTPRLSKRVILPVQHAEHLQRIMQKMPSLADSDYRYAKYFSKKRYSKSYKKNKRKSKRKSRRTHRVRSGETLYRIALRHGTTVKKIMRINRLRSSRVRAGKRLRIA
ncbi:MAG: transglycosylase SLT domain-containing protein [Cocleimonas sp.]|nr:transglycosylase SLT domain-containing protein [Cocleimonas sp.]